MLFGLVCIGRLSRTNGEPHANDPTSTALGPIFTTIPYIVADVARAMGFPDLLSGAEKAHTGGTRPRKT